MRGGGRDVRVCSCFAKPPKWVATPFVGHAAFELCQNVIADVLVNRVERLELRHDLAGHGSVSLPKRLSCLSKRGVKGATFFSKRLLPEHRLFVV